ncbi:hypothetical protein [Hippea maritima]|uniref:Uncharacterized protein n=1 Tax=Hippea maritima (strain ATCC 700847 / DSM 10411 / MH2) TaxID=760142 RepID=F2LUH3_HIPMA|nr:hypothetical protein [Hippea maritima]AEA33499.1 hypothetical protein Hipma_0528 [Hippea maritima DSM 10411]
MCDQIKVNIDKFFIKHEIVKLKLILKAIENPQHKLPPARDIAIHDKVSELTVKKVEKELVQKGYLISNKKGGTRTTSKFTKQQISNFISSKEAFKSSVESLIKSGFSEEDILSLVYDVLSHAKRNQSNIIYTEKDEAIAIFAKSQIEDSIGCGVGFKPFDTLKSELSNRALENKIIVAPFFCSPQLESFIYEEVKLVPLRATHPLEGLAENKEIPFGSRIFYIAASKMDKENSISVYQDVLKDRFRLYVYTQDEILANRHFLSFADVVVGYSWIVKNNEFLFKNIKHVVSRNRFYDDEGLEMIKYLLESISEED